MHSTHGEWPPSLILITGLPGVGKSTLAEAVGRRLQTPVFSLDWVLGAVVQSRACPPSTNYGALGLQLLLMLAHRQLMLGQSAIIDAPGHEPAWRDPFVDEARSDNTELRIIEVQCPDEALHCARVVGRSRGIPGWHEFNWSHVERMTMRWQPWPAGTERLTVDSTKPLDDAVNRTIDYFRQMLH